MKTVMTRAKAIELLKDGAMLEYNCKHQCYHIVKDFISLGTVRRPTAEQLIARNIVHEYCKLGPCATLYKR